MTRMQPRKNTPGPAPLPTPRLWLVVMGATLVAGGVALAAGTMTVLSALIDVTLQMTRSTAGSIGLLTLLLLGVLLGLARAVRGPSGPGRMAPFH
jgi:hypothetical protein